MVVEQTLLVMLAVLVVELHKAELVVQEIPHPQAPHKVLPVVLLLVLTKQVVVVVQVRLVNRLLALLVVPAVMVRQMLLLALQ